MGLLPWERDFNEAALKFLRPRLQEMAAVFELMGFDSVEIEEARKNNLVAFRFPLKTHGRAAWTAELSFVPAFQVWMTVEIGDLPHHISFTRNTPVGKYFDADGMKDDWTNLMKSLRSEKVIRILRVLL